MLSPKAINKQVTLLEAVRTSLEQAARHNPGEVAPPAAILWTDADGQWMPLVEQLRSLMPELLTLGTYDPATRTGPAIWLRCVIEPSVRTENFPELDWPEDAVPVIYMPNVGRQTLRAAEECPPKFRPLVELQFRGTVWTQRNGRDWTVEAFLVTTDGELGLDVARDSETRCSMLGALRQLALTPAAKLAGRRLEAEDFDKLMIGDTPRDLLLWLSDPERIQHEWDSEKRSAFRNRCREDYGFDPEEDGELSGGEKLGLREGAWLGVWQRFSESPGLYPGIPALLKRAKPTSLLFTPDAWPDEAESMECGLREALNGLSDVPAATARERILALEAEHGGRRSWVWAKLGMCPLAFALEQLAVLAETTATLLGGPSVDEIAKQYRKKGYRADGAVLRAMECVSRNEDRQAVVAAIRSTYLPWLEDAATEFQERLATESDGLLERSKPPDVQHGDCVLFVDGLRYDLGERLAALAEERGLEVSRSWRWSALPTVTATAKPAVSPVSNIVERSVLGADYTPQSGADNKPLDAKNLRHLLQEAGFELAQETVLGAPLKTGAKGWAECGQFDKLGHDLGMGLAGQIEDQLSQVLETVTGLLSVGWKRVRVVTDHGWLLVPGGLPFISLPKYLAESRWSRCAAVKDTSHVEIPVFGWTWNPSERFAVAPGIHCFISGREYAHGGISPQECVIPELILVASGVSSDVKIRVTEIRWAGLRSRIAIDPVVTGLKADLRTKPNDPNSSVVEPKALDSDGRASLLVEDEGLQGTAACVVILDSADHLLTKESTTIGGDT